MRLFIAAPVSEDFKNKACEVQSLLKSAGADVKWVSSGNMHFTLQFLGDTQESSINDIKRALQAVKSFPAFDVSLSGAGAFESVETPKVLWLGLSRGAQDLQKLAEVVSGELSKTGLVFQKKLFSPHLTLGRTRSPRNIAGLAEKLKEIPDFSTVSMRISSVDLVESILRPEGPLYKTLFSVKLK